MNQYEKLANSLQSTKTLASHIKDLGKIKLATEDSELVKGIERAISLLQGEHVRSKSKSTPVALDNTKIPELKSLLSYCKSAIGTKKPEWQIMAERNGWKPS